MKTFYNGVILGGQTIGFLSIILVLGGLLTFLGFNENSDSEFIGIALILFWAILIFRYRGVELDLENKTVRPFISYIGIKVGKKRNANEFRFYSVKNLRTNHNYTISSISSSYETNSTALILYDSVNEDELIVTKNDIEELEALGKEISEKLSIPRK